MNPQQNLKVSGMTNMKPNVLASALIVLLGVTLSGCLSDAPKPAQLDLSVPVTATAADMAGSTTPISIDGGTLLSAHDMFEELVLPLMTGTDPSANGKGGACGPCHSINGGVGPAFLQSDTTSGPYDPYTTISTWPDFIVPDLSQSQLLTKGQHEGPSMCPPLEQCVPGTSTMWDTVYAWLNQENIERAAQSVTPFQPQVPPFTPLISTAGKQVLNTVDLSQISASFTGITIQFYATLLPNDQGIQLSGLKLFNVDPNPQPNEQRTVHIQHPLFLVWTYGVPHPDPVDSFSSTDMTIALNQNDVGADGGQIAGAGNLIAPGLVTLSQFRPYSSLSIVFSTVALVGTVSGGNPCSAAGQNIFNTQVVPTYIEAKSTTGTYVGCIQAKCHDAITQQAGLNMGVVLATGATLTSNLTTLCQTMKFYNSLNVLTANTDPVNQNVHPFKWSAADCTAGQLPSNCFTNFTTVLQSWATAEQ